MSQVDPATLNQIALNVDQSLKNLHEIFLALPIIMAILIKPIVNIFFAWTCYNTLKIVPRDKQELPGFLCWFFVIPIAGYIFQWIMLPFAIPKTLKNFHPNDKLLCKQAKFLFITGLIYLILELGFFIPGISFLAIIPFIMYWVKVKKVRALLKDIFSQKSYPN
jgi:hypothetical protein